MKARRPQGFKGWHLLALALFIGIPVNLLVFFSRQDGTTRRESLPEQPCKDDYAPCPQWAAQGRCDRESSIQDTCRLSCGVCEYDEERDAAATLSSAHPRTAKIQRNSPTPPPPARQIRGEVRRQQPPAPADVVASVQQPPSPSLGLSPSASNPSTGSAAAQTDGAIAGGEEKAPGPPVVEGEAPVADDVDLSESDGYQATGMLNSIRLRFMSQQLSSVRFKTPVGRLNIDPEDCVDTDEVQCAQLAAKLGCIENREEMTRQCPKACHVCSGQACENKLSQCEIWAYGGECTRNPGFMFASCPKSCFTCDFKWTASPSPYAAVGRGLVMPSIGFGTAGLGKQTYQSVLWALGAGYRHLDTAQAEEWYEEAEVGRALADSGVPRNQVFLTSKLHPRDLGYERTLAQVQLTLRRLSTSFIDLFMLHYPSCWGGLCGDEVPEGTWRDSWRALEELHESGKVLTIGVSNFSPNQLAELVAEANIHPQVVQSRCDLLKQDRQLQHLTLNNQIQYVAYSSLGTQWAREGFPASPVLSHPTVLAISAAIERTPAQVVLRWALQHGQIVIPRSSNKARIAENLDLYSFSLEHAEMSALDQLDGTEPQPVALT